MNNFNFASPVTPLRAQEVALRARKMEKQQALMVAELAAEVDPAGRKRRRSFMSLLTALFLGIGARV